MLTFPTGAWFPRTITFGVWALAATSAVFWGLKWDGRAAVAPPPAFATQSATVVDSGAVARLLGSAGNALMATVSAPNRFVLVGVVARTASHTGAALIAVDGKPAKAFSVGSRIEEGLYLQSVQGRRASLSNGPAAPAAVTLELPVPSLAPAANPVPTASPLGGLQPTLGVTALPVAAAPNAAGAAPAPAQSPRAGRRLRSAGTGDTQD